MEELTKMLQKIGRGGEIQSSWKDGMVVPIYKKGDKDQAENYRGITLMNTDYKIHAAVLRSKLEKKFEETQILQETQMGFRRGRGTRDAITLLKNIIDDGLSKEKNIYACFVDLKTAFDKVDRRKLWEIMEGKGISAEITEAIRALFAETRCKVRIGGKIVGEFWTKKGLKQGCPLSRLLFIIYISSIEEEMTKKGNGRCWQY